MTEPPILRGDAAKLNTVMRELTGAPTAADYQLWGWIVSNQKFMRDALPNIVKNQIFNYTYIYKGEQIWPPE
jgi:hypothetical protein